MAAKNKKNKNAPPVVNSNGSTSIPSMGGSPLKIFGEAKDRINGLYVKLEDSVGKACKFYSDPRLDNELLKSVDIQRLRQLNKSIETIKLVLSRNQMKVAFFGKTSNGKSTVINAILHDRVLPMGYGHTTGCFLQIQGDNTQEPYYEVQKEGQENQKHPIHSVKHIANALNSGSLECSTLVKIFWPIAKCPLLKYDVVLVDSPGVDLEENLDEWIDEHCHDADVFVLVSNAESALNNTEKHFFHKVSEKLSKPNIFILNNRWDSVAEDPDSMDQVKAQHIERAVHFLSEELKISSPDEAKDRTFFVSAKETLLQRCQATRQDSNKTEIIKAMTEEFACFERRFEESLSRSAVKTKFKKHTDKGLETISELSQVLKATQKLVLDISQKKLQDLELGETIHRTIESSFYANEQSFRQQILEIKKRIHIISDTEFDNEIRRLSRIVDDFELPFSPDPMFLVSYKEKLYQHVEESLSESLRNKITTAIKKHVMPYNSIMCEVATILSPERQQRLIPVLDSQQYVQDDLFDLKIYKHFYHDFQEDLEFRFSLGLVSLVRKFKSRFTPGGVKTSEEEPYAMSDNTHVVSIVERFIMNPPQSPTTVGSLAVGGVLVRTVGWKVIAITTLVYGALYAYEYLTWTNSAKERALKSQYVKHARKGLSHCVPIISQNIADSVEKRILTTYSMIKEEVDLESNQVNTKITNLKSSLDKLLVCDKFTSELLGENEVLLTELMAFATSFLN